MAFRPLIRQRAVVPAAMAAFATAAVFAPSTVHAEEQPQATPHRKPIYDDLPLDTTAPTLPKEPTNSSQPAQSTPADAYRPTPTDLLAVQIGRARLGLHHQAVRAEAAVDRALTSTLRLEHSFTSTVRALAPPPESHEKLLPGALYVLVASMAGSIVTRNRNILLRASLPLAVGITAAKLVLPVTTANVGDLVWRYEKKYPVLADAHLRTRDSISHVIETGKAHTLGTVGLVESKLADTRQTLEGWVSKGR